MFYLLNLCPKRFNLQCFIFGVLMCLLSLSPVIAMAESEKEGKSAEEHYRHQIVAFGGNTHDGSDHGAALALGYLHILGPHFRIGGFVERATGDFDLWLIGFDTAVFPIGGWYIRAAPSVEFEESETRFVFRLGTGYEFDLGPRWSIAPEINYDNNRREREHTFVYGIAAAYKF
ncbi:hypothetical protein D3OALGA1CA_781 [Olavius algarvensis associated proteobacterium Delta 3]|nr:hypothetical protein D3OALGA1CA_781 [Olavius algarvensis associated proteobacterium Delta 3]CAB5142061.1 hypothetical protein D3OALGB2SA_4285 [Olavius algarvensis associated proteobacterium Delta 3]